MNSQLVSPRVHTGDDSSLHVAVRLGQTEEVRKILMQRDVNVNCLNSKHETPLHLACALGLTVASGIWC